MKSGLHQRLRAARTFANLSQQAIATACAVSRPAVSQWEALEQEKRTAPGLEQIKIVAKVCGVPLEWLIDDEADPESVWRFRAEKTWRPAASPAPAKPTASREDFAAGIRFELAVGAAPFLASFDQEALEWRRGDEVVAFVLPGDALDPVVGRLLLSPSSRRTLVVVVAMPLPAQASALTAALHIDVVSAAGISEAARLLLR